MIAFWRGMQVSDLAPTEFHTMLAALGLAQRHVAEIFDVEPRSVRRWQRGDRRTPVGVAVVFRLLVAKVVTVAQVEEAAVSIPAVRTNGSAKGKPPAEPVSDQSASACVEAAALADGCLTTAEKVCALAPGACRWPLGDPRDRDFCFCGDPVVAAPYCEHHRAKAYLAPRTGGGRGVRVGFVAHGRQPRSQQAPAHGPSTPSVLSATGAFRRAENPVALNHEANPC